MKYIIYKKHNFENSEKNKKMIRKWQKYKVTKYKKEKINFKYLKRRIRVTNIGRCNLAIKETLRRKKIMSLSTSFYRAFHFSTRIDEKYAGTKTKRRRMCNERRSSVSAPLSSRWPILRRRIKRILTSSLNGQGLETSLLSFNANSRVWVITLVHIYKSSAELLFSFCF